MMHVQGVPKVVSQTKVPRIILLQIKYEITLYILNRFIHLIVDEVFFENENEDLMIDYSEPLVEEIDYDIYDHYEIDDYNDYDYSDGLDYMDGNDYNYEDDCDYIDF